MGVFAQARSISAFRIFDEKSRETRLRAPRREGAEEGWSVEGNGTDYRHRTPRAGTNTERVCIIVCGLAILHVPRPLSGELGRPYELLRADRSSMLAS